MFRKTGLLLIVFLLAGCSLFQQKMPDDLQAQMSKVLDEGAILNAMTEQGVNYLNFGTQLAKTRGAYNLAASMWPEDFAPEAKASFDKAFEGWDWALYMWQAKIEEYDNPVEPDINHFDEIVSYLGDQALFEVHPNNFIVKDYQNKKYLPFDETISILLSMASEHFQSGQTLVQPTMK